MNAALEKLVADEARTLRTHLARDGRYVVVSVHVAEGDQIVSSLATNRGTPRHARAAASSMDKHCRDLRSAAKDVEQRR